MNLIKLFFSLLVLIIFLSSCSLPQIQTMPPGSSPDIQCRCQAIFPTHRMQFVHSLTAILPNGDINVAIGVTTVDPDMESIHCAIITIEGMVLFEAEYNQQKITINRSIPPFDSMEFAQNILNDIRLVFFKPTGDLLEAGGLPPDANICRYQQPDGMIEDVITHQNDNWEIHQYTSHYKQTKTIKAYYADTSDQNISKTKEKIPLRYEITTHGILGYSLILELIEVQQNPS
ncbi:MAG: DUF3261 domain-containing protein [Desulfobacteraceae bacterium]|nr:DUF3261 domain-containing protein [Desulfobacteraceae bacterium]